MKVEVAVFLYKWAVLENKESSLLDLHNLHTQMETFAQHAVMNTDTQGNAHNMVIYILLCIYIDILVMLYVYCVYRDRKFHI